MIDMSEYHARLHREIKDALWEVTTKYAFRHVLNIRDFVREAQNSSDGSIVRHTTGIYFKHHD